MTTKIARPSTRARSMRSTAMRLTVMVALALTAGACSTIAEIDPTGLLSDDASPTSPSDQFPADASAAQPPDAGTTPDLASLPARPAPTASTAPAQQQQVAQQVAADGTQAQYSADALRAGTESAAPPPAGAQPMMVASAAAPSAAPSASDAAPTASDLPPSASDAPPTASDAAPTASPAPAPAMVAAAPAGTGAVPAVGPAPVRAARASAPAPVEAAPVQTAAATPVDTATPGSEPAVPAVPPQGARNSRGVMLASAGASDAALGFKPSTAPPLNPSISNWVSAPILAHYRQTASAAGTSGVKTAAVPAVSDGAPMRKGRKGTVTAMGGPGMSGAVVANMDALSGGGAATGYSGLPPTAVVYFAGDGTSLSAAARGHIRDAVVAFRAGGGAGTVRVVGHASSRTANMPVERHLEVIFDKSQKRANIVAQELIHQGIPADKVMIESVGDSQPVYYESMPKGEDGNRRAEIFVQG